MSDEVGSPEDRFSHNRAHLLFFFCILGQVLAVASNDGTIKMYEVSNGTVSPAVK